MQLVRIKSVARSNHIGSLRFIVSSVYKSRKQSDWIGSYSRTTGNTSGSN